MSRVLVIGATGTVGRQVVSQLLARGTPVRAMVRNPLSAALPPQVEVRQGDLTIPETLVNCLDGIDTVFLVWVAPPDTAAPVVEHISRRARRIVLLSSPYKTPHPFFQQPNRLRLFHAQLEQLVEASGMEWTFLRPGIFAANARLWWAPQIRSGDVVRWPYAAAATAPIHESDIAAVAVRVLTEQGHAGAEYVLTGPESSTQAEQVSTIGRALGRNLRYEEISPEQARRELLLIIPAPPIIEMLLNAWGAAVDQPAFITSRVADLTGFEPRTFFEWSIDHALDFRC